MMIGKGMMSVILVLALFAGPGVLHVAQMLGILRVDIAITPTDAMEYSPMPSSGRKLR